ncbi:MAG: hypothetical protein IJ993_05350 [Akkermansia sp.]|nr:hypothetical protein [Akkermansia sp.]
MGHRDATMLRARLRWQDVDFEDSIISIRARNSKTGGARHIELHPTLAAWLHAYRLHGVGRR